MTNGEATDGHIVDVSSLKVPDTLPMFPNHVADPLGRLGQLHTPRKSGKGQTLGGRRLHMTGRIDLEGEGALADIRRDVAHGIHVGDITQMSGRWTGGTETARSGLPKNHWAFSDGGYRGLLFEGSAMREGSVVGLGSDEAALIGRSHDLGKPEHVRNFYNTLINGEAEDVADLFEEIELEEIELEEIALTGGARVRVPVEVARVWGQSVEPDVSGLPGLDQIEESLEIEVEDTQRGDPEIVPVLEDSRSAEPLGFGAAEVAGMDGVLTAIRERFEKSDAILERQLEKLLYERLGSIPK
jgi:hypothetical protein